MGRSGKYELQVFRATNARHDNFLEAISRRNDTFYVVSFRFVSIYAVSKCVRGLMTDDSATLSWGLQYDAVCAAIRPNKNFGRRATQSPNLALFVWLIWDVTSCSVCVWSVVWYRTICCYRQPRTTRRWGHWCCWWCLRSEPTVSWQFTRWVWRYFRPNSK